MLVGKNLTTTDGTYKVLNRSDHQKAYWVQEIIIEEDGSETSGDCMWLTKSDIKRKSL